MPGLIQVPAGHSTHRFTVIIDGVNFAVFTECTLPSIDVKTEDVIEGGLNAYVHKLPQRIDVGPVRLSHGIARNSQLVALMMYVYNGDIATARRDVTVKVSDITQQTLMEMTFFQAFPVKYVGPTLKSGDNAVAIEQIEFAHSGLAIA